MVITLRRREPTGIDVAFAMKDGGACNLDEGPSYTPSPAGERLRRYRVRQLKLGLRTAAEAIGMGHVELGELERGAKELVHSQDEGRIMAAWEKVTKERV